MYSVALALRRAKYSSCAGEAPQAAGFGRRRRPLRSCPCTAAAAAAAVAAAGARW
jgi:hypothetical protein